MFSVLFWMEGIVLVQCLFTDQIHVEFPEKSSIEGPTQVFHPKKPGWMKLVAMQGDSMTAKCSFKDPKKSGENLTIFLTYKGIPEPVPPDHTISFLNTMYAKFSQLKVPPPRKEWRVVCHDEDTEIRILVQDQPLPINFSKENCVLTKETMMCTFTPSLPKQQSHTGLQFVSAQPITAYYIIECFLQNNNRTVDGSSTHIHTGDASMQQTVKQIVSFSDELLKSEETNITIQVTCVTPLMNVSSNLIIFQTSEREQIRGVGSTSIISTTPTSVCLTWSIPDICGKNCTTKIILGGGPVWSASSTKVLESNTTYLCIDELQPFSDYKVSLAVKLKSSNVWSNLTDNSVVKFATNITKPSSNSEYLQGNYILHPSSTNICETPYCFEFQNCSNDCAVATIYWKPVEERFRNGPGFGYYVRVRSNCHDTWTVYNTSADTTSASLKMLKETRLQVQVGSKNVAGNGPEIQSSMSIRAADYVDGRDALIMYVMEDQNLSVTWNLPAWHATTLQNSLIFLHWCQKMKKYEDSSCHGSMDWIQMENSSINIQQHQLQFVFNLRNILPAYNISWSEGESSSVDVEQLLFGVQLFSTGNLVDLSEKPYPRGVVVPRCLYKDGAATDEEVVSLSLSVVQQHVKLLATTSCRDVCAPSLKFYWRVCEINADPNSCYNVVTTRPVTYTNDSQWNFFKRKTSYRVSVKLASRHNSTSGEFFPQDGIVLQAPTTETSIFLLAVIGLPILILLLGCIVFLKVRSLKSEYTRIKIKLPEEAPKVSPYNSQYGIPEKPENKLSASTSDTDTNDTTFELEPVDSSLHNEVHPEMGYAQVTRGTTVDTNCQNKPPLGPVDSCSTEDSGHCQSSGDTEYRSEDQPNGISTPYLAHGHKTYKLNGNFSDGDFSVVTEFPYTTEGA